jgi:DeoR/GlpR family transcriptional regulator of sugar metabolism
VNLSRNRAQENNCTPAGVADSSKVGMTSPAVICPVGDIDILITDDGVSDDAVNAFRRSDVQVVII